MTTDERLALTNRAVAEIIDDLQDRRGLGNEWEMIEPDIQTEIQLIWTNIVALAIEQAELNGYAEGFDNGYGQAYEVYGTNWE